MKHHRQSMLVNTRRGFLLQTGGLMVSAAALSGGLAACSPGSAVPLLDAAPKNLQMSQFQLLARISDLLIPETDTPGALAAGATEFVDELLSDWAQAQTRLDLEAALELIDMRANTDHGALFLDLSDDAQVAVLQAHEAACFSAIDDPSSANDSAEMRGDGIAGYRNLKRLIYRGYYHSEIGCTEELQFELIPGPEARIDAPLSEVGKTWAA